MRNLALGVLLTLLTIDGAAATPFGTIPMRETPPAPREAPKEAPKAARPRDAGKAASAQDQLAKRPRKGGPPNICERELERASKKYKVPLQILYAVGLTESGYGGVLPTPPPYLERSPARPAVQRGLEQPPR